MTNTYGNDNVPGALVLTWLTLAAAGCATAPGGDPGGQVPGTSRSGGIVFAGAPAATFTAIRPLDGDAIVYEPLAPRIATAPLDGQLSIDVVVRNDQASNIDVDHVRLSYTGGVALPSVTLEDHLKKKCSSEDVVDLVDDRTIAPGESCRLILLDDQKIPVPAPQQVTIDVFFTGFSLPLTVTKALNKYRNSNASGSYRFFAKAEDLPDGQFWSANSSGAGSHHRTSIREFYAHDAGVKRWDSVASEWSGLRPGTDGTHNDDYLVWGQPVYAMADGVVIGFDNSRDDNVPPVTASNPNFFTIQHGDEVGSYLHFQKGSLNPALLSPGAVVHAGDFLGLAGNSGHSTSPHVHVDVSVDGVGRPLLFHEAFVIDRSTGVLGSPPNFDAPFTAIEDQGLPWEPDIVWPSPFRRTDQASDAAISSVAITHASTSRAVTAVRTSSGNLQLVSWDIAGDGAITRKDDESTGQASEIVVAHPDNVVTALRNSAGNLQLITWSVAASGAITRLHDDTAGAVSKVAVTELPVGFGVATAFRHGNGDLGVIAWQTDGFGTITRKGSATAEAISDVAITTVDNPFHCVVTAARNGDGNLAITTWEITSDKQVIRRDDDLAGAISQVALTTVREDFGRQVVIAAVRNGDGDLELIAWDVSATGQLTRRGEVHGGAIASVAVASDGAQEIISAVREGSGQLKLIAWQVSSSGEFVREGEASAGEVSAVALSGSFSSGGKRFAMPAMRDDAGALRLISWQTNLTP